MPSVTPIDLQLFASLDIKAWDLPREQIREFVRALILSNRLRAGAPIPSTRAFGALWKKDPTTVHLALADLVKEGLLIRRSGKGTFVTDRGQSEPSTSKKMTCLGVYMVHSVQASEMETFNALCRRLRDVLTPRGVDIKMWSVDVNSDRTQPYAPLVEAIRQGEIQGLVVPISSSEELEWMSKLPIPIAHVTSGSLISNRVMPDYKEMLRLSLGALRDQGCRSIGFISTFTSRYVDFYDFLLETSLDLGLETRNEWLRMPPPDFQPPTMAGYGYQQFQEIWSLKNRPDGMLIWPDHVAAGAVTAILENRINVPEDLKVILHVNDAIAYPCPFPATLVVTKIGVWADELLKMVEAQLAGEEVSPVMLPSFLHSTPLAPAYLK